LDCPSKLSYADTNNALDPVNVECRQMGTQRDTCEIDPDGWGQATPFKVLCRNGAALVMANSYVKDNGEFLSSVKFEDLIGDGDTPISTGTLDNNVLNTKTVTPLAHWMHLGNVLRVDMGSSIEDLSNQAGYPFTLQNETPDSTYQYPLWLTAERVTYGTVSFGLYEARPTGFSYGATDNDNFTNIACAISYPGPFWYGNSTKTPSNAADCWLGTLWGKPNENLPIWNNKPTGGAPNAQNFGAFWVKDVVFRKDCDGLNAGSYFVDASFVGGQKNGSDAPPEPVHCDDSNDLTWTGLDRLLTPFADIKIPANWKSALHRYLFFPHNVLGWEAARAECLIRGGDLVTIDSSDEQSWLDAQFTLRGKGSWWIGLNNPTGKPLAWANGSDYDSDKWNPRFAWPTDTVPPRRCVSYGWSTGDWSAEDCATAHPFVCEVP
jgi:hypothetical protein